MANGLRVLILRSSPQQTTDNGRWRIAVCVRTLPVTHRRFQQNLYSRRQIRHTCEAIRGDVATEQNQPSVSDVSPPQTLCEMFALWYRDILLSPRKRDDLLLICASVRVYDIAIDRPNEIYFMANSANVALTFLIKKLSFS